MFTIIIPFFNGHEYIYNLLSDIPAEMPVVIVDDHSDQPFPAVDRPHTTVYRPAQKQYFTGAVNYAIARTTGDVLVLNQDVRLTGTAWLDLIAEKRSEYALIGERIKGPHPAFPNGYVHGVFQFMRRDAIEAAGLMDEENYPLWGATAVWQWQVCRRGFKALPLDSIPGLSHERKATERYGSSIRQLLQRSPADHDRLIRTPPLVSVIIPAFNHGRYLADAINSLVGGPTSLGHMSGQTFHGFEVIIVDDGSTDNTAEIAKELADPWKGVRYIRRRNGGTPAANNTGIKEAVGRYICMMCADDMREPWSLNDLYQAANRNPHSVIYDEPTLIQDGKRGELFPVAGYDFATLLERNMMHMGIMFEKAAWQEVGGYREQMKHGREDWAFNVALGERGYCGVKLGRSGYLYRRHGQNRTMTNTSLEWREHFRMQMEQLFPHLYRGDWPMACCGKPNKRTNEVAAPRGLSRAALPSGGDMVLLEYTGLSIGSSNWAGPGAVPSGRYYRFGGNVRDKVKYVEKSDVQWFLERRDEGRQLFAVHTPIEQSKPQEKTAEGGALTLTGDLTIVKHSVVEVPDFPDPDTLTVAQIRALALTPEQWAALGEKETAGKARATVLEWAANHAKPVE
jgi:glycosyltransferase involved in cell wall biosynthesis